MNARAAKAVLDPPSPAADPADSSPQDTAARLPEAGAILQHAVEEVASLLHVDGGMVYLLDEEHGDLRFAHDAGITDDRRRAWVRGLRLPLGVGMFGRAAAERRVLVTDDYSADSSFPHAPEADRVVDVADIRSMVVAPLLDGDRAIGALGAFSTQPAAFGPSEIALTRALADHAAAALSNRRLIDQLARSELELERRADRERTLRDIWSRLATIRDPSALLQDVVDAASRLVGADGTVLSVLDDEAKVLRWGYDDGIRSVFDPAFVADLTLDAGAGLTGRAMAEGRVTRGDDDLKAQFPDGPENDHFFDVTGFRSLVCAPIINERGPLGALEVYSRRPSAFDDTDAEVLGALADQAAIAMTNARLIDELGRSREQISARAAAEQALREIAARITAIRDPGDVVQRSVDEAARLLHGDGARIDVIDERLGLLRGVYMSGGQRPSEDIWPETPDEMLDQGISGQAVSRSEVVWTGDYLADEGFPHASGSDTFVRNTGIQSVIAAPLIGEDGAFGALTVYSKDRDAFGEGEATLLAALADQAAIALTNARLIEELGRSREQLARRVEAERALREIAARVTALRDPDEVLQFVIEEAPRLLAADGAMINLVSEAGEMQWARAEAPEGIDFAILDTTDLEEGVGLSGLVMAEGRTIATGDYLGDARFGHSPERDRFIAEGGLRSVVAAPILVDAAAIGTITVFTRRSDAFGPTDERVLGVLGDLAAVAITNTRLITELRASREQLARRADAERTLREIAARITAIRDSGEVLQDVVTEAARLLGADGAVIDLLDETSGQFDRAYDVGVDPDVRDEWVRIRLGEAAGRAAVSNRALTVIDDLVADERVTGTPESAAFAKRNAIRAVAIAPLVGESRALGTLSVFSHEPGRWDSADADLLVALADQAAVAVNNARLIEALNRSGTELARRADSERSLREIAARITAISDPAEVLERIVDESRRLLGSDGAHLTLVSDDGTYLRPVVVSGTADQATQEWMRGLEFPIDGGINGLAAGSNRVISTPDYLTDPRIPLEPSDVEAARRMELAAMASAPLRAPGGDVIGTLAISYRLPREFEDEELQLLQGLADHAAIALANSRLLEQLRESEEAYRHLVQNSPDLVWSIGADTRFVFVSDTAERLTGWKPEDLIGRHFGALVHPSSRDVAERDWNAGQPDGARELRGRLNLLHRDGHPVPAEFIALSRIEGGRFVGANGSVRDMTERDRLERELRDSEERYRFLVENSPDIVFATDADGRYTYYSETVEHLTGWQPGELLGQHFSAIVDMDTFPAAAQAWQQYVEQPSVLQVHRFALRTRDGDQLPVEVNAVGMVDEAGRFAGIHGSARDMTDRERLERGLRRQAAELASSQERAHLARELHDSVTQALFSMTLITRSIEVLLERDVAAARERIEVLRDLQRDALAEMRSLIFELRPGSLEQDGLVHALRTHVAAVGGRIGLPIVFDTSGVERLPSPIEDGLYRIAQEALHNVVKHAAAHQVAIELTAHGGEVVLRITDDGKGFDPKHVGDGHFGLDGMRSRAERLGGRLEMRTAPGEGTRIEVALPVPASDGAGDRAGDALAVSGDGAASTAK